MKTMTCVGYLRAFTLTGTLLSATCAPTVGEVPPPAPPAGDPQCALVSYAPPVLPEGYPVPFYEASAFLFTPPAASGEYQPSAVQVGVAAGVIQRNQIARVTGQARKADGTPLRCVRVSIVDNPQYGYTLSRENGKLDLAVNSGVYTVRFELDGYLPVQRPLYAAALDWTVLPEVVLVPLSGAATPVAMGAAQVQIAHGQRNSDPSGERQVNLLFQPGTQAAIRLRDGTRRPVSSLNIRSTEYTVGALGVQAMPGELPVNSAYTYAVELTADEVLKDPQAAGIEFDRPVISYVDNFIAFPVGSVVPSGYYDVQAKEWVASDNGRVIQILAVADGKARLDVTGRGKAATQESLDQLGITDAELRALADPTLYQPGQILWRVALNHFTPYDFNWPAVPPDAVSPPSREPSANSDLFHGVCQGKETATVVELDKFSTIDCTNMVIRYHVPVDGVAEDGTTKDFALTYTNRRVSAFTSDANLFVPLSDAVVEVPPSVKSILLNIKVAGRNFPYVFDPTRFTRDLVASFAWDGLDGDGRTWRDQAPATATVTYRYDAYYYPSFDDSVQQFNRFSSPISVTPIFSGGRLLYDISRSWSNGLVLYRPRTEDAGLGGFVPSVQHRYLERQKQLELGDGRRLSTQESQTQLGLTIERYVGADDQTAGRIDGSLANARLNTPKGLFFSANSNPKYRGLFVADYGNCQVRQITDSGVSTFAGLSVTGDCTTADVKNNVGKLDAPLGGINSILMGADGNFYIASPSRRVVHVVNLNESVPPKEYLFTVAGNGTAGGGAGDDASRVGIGEAAGLALGSSLHDAAKNTRTLYVSGSRDTSPAVIQRVDVDVRQNKTTQWVTRVPLVDNGIIQTGTTGSRFTTLLLVEDFHDAANPKHTLYALDTGKSQIWRHTITPDPVDKTKDKVVSVLIAGTGTAGWNGDGADATKVQLNQPRGMTLSPRGDILYIADTGNHVVRRISGLDSDTGVRSLLTIAGDATKNSGKGCTETRTFANNVQLGDPEGLWATASELYVSDSKNHSICKLKPEEGFAEGDLFVIAHDDAVKNTSWLYYFRRTFAEGGAVPGEHVRTRRGPLGNRDPAKAPVEYEFSYANDPSSGGRRVLSRLKGKDLVKATEFTLDFTYSAGSVSVQDATSKKQTNLMFSSDGLVTDIHGMDTGNRWHLDYAPVVTEGLGRVKKGLLLKATDQVTNAIQNFTYDPNGRLLSAGGYKLITKSGR